MASQPELEHVVVVSAARHGITRWHASTVYSIAGPPVPASPGYHFFFDGPRLREIVRAERPDVIEMGSPFAAPWLLRYALRGWRAPVVGFLHSDLRTVYVDHVLDRRPPAVRRYVDAVLRRYVRSVYRRCDRTVAASASAARALEQLGLEAPATIPLGVDADLFHPDKRDPDWKREIGASQEQPVVLYVGRLSREKGVETLLRAIPALHARHGVKVVLVGTGHMRPHIEDLATRNPHRLVLLPYHDDRAALARVYASAELLIAPCPFETFGIAALEGMASGLPVAGVDAGAIGELLSGSDWARVFEPGSSRGLAGAVAELLRADCRALGAAARRAVAERYSWERTFDELVRTYRSAKAEVT